MSKQMNELSALLAGLLGNPDVQFIQITPREGQSMDDAVAEAEAKHREECAGCAADHAIEQAAKAKIDQDAANQKAAAEAKQAAGEAPKRNPLGYMAVITRDGVAKAISGSFNTDREAVAKKLELLSAFGPMQMLTKIAELIGQDAPTVEVKPVYL